MCVCLSICVKVCIPLHNTVEWDVCRAVTNVYLHVFLVKDTLSLHCVCVRVSVRSHCLIGLLCI